jgi:excisionase family DNA binding protein
MEALMTTRPEASSTTEAAEEQWLTPKEICTQLQIPEQTFYQWRVKHIGPRAYRIGRHLRISRSDFNAWLSSRLET